MTLTTAASKPAAHALEPVLITIPAAWFLMGSNSGQDCERPIHRVWVDAFQLASTQITITEYAQFLSATGAAPPPFWQDVNFNRPQQPVAGVSWHEANRYCEWLGSQTGRAYRLPTEAEWELAARGGLEQKTFPWGDTPPQSLTTTPPAGRPAPSPSPATPRTPSDSTTSATTSTNGAATGTTPTTTPSRPNSIPAARSKAR